MTTPLQVVEYNQSTIIEWDSLAECARSHKVSTEYIKRMIYYGDSMNTTTTFDIPTYCDMDIKEENGKLIIYNTRKTVKIKRTKKKKVYHPEHEGTLCLPEGVAI